MGQGTHAETQCNKAYTEETDKHLWIGEAILVIEESCQAKWKG